MKTSWRDSALCTDYDTDLFFPDGETGRAAVAQIETAKDVCHDCPVLTVCRDWALENRVEHGVWGGLSGDERRLIHRRATRKGTTAIEVVKVVPKAFPTIAAALAARSAVEDGHAVWTGSRHFTVGGIRRTASRAAFGEMYGRPPVGMVRSTCDRPWCITHLEDQKMRERCGTRAGYRRHRRDGEDACRECLNANADHDRRLRNTGTTKKKQLAT